MCSIKDNTLDFAVKENSKTLLRSIYISLLDFPLLSLRTLSSFFSHQLHLLFKFIIPTVYFR